MLHACPYRPAAEEIWRRRAFIVKEDLRSIPEYTISSIAVIRNAKGFESGNGRGRSSQEKAIIVATRQLPRRDGAAGIRATGGSTGIRIRNMRNATGSNRRIAIDARRSMHGIAKMDALRAENIITSGRYRLVPLCSDMIAKMDALIVEIDVVSKGCSIGLQGP